VNISMMKSAMKVTKMSPLVGAEVTGVDLTKPLEGETQQKLNKALVDNIALVIRDQKFTAKKFYEAGSLFGEPMERDYSEYNIPDAPFVHQISSHDRNKDNSLKKTGPKWHTDHANHEYPPKYTTLYALELFRTGGGSTGIANTRAAYDALPEDLKKRIDGMKTVNVIAGSASKDINSDRLAWQAKANPEPVIQPLVRTNADTGKKAIYFHPGRVENIVGMSPEDSHKLLEELLERALKPEFIYNHQWKLGDMLIWDNRSALHRANYDYDVTDMTQQRLMYRMLVKGERPV
jgi:taurine dioxygenase